MTNFESDLLTIRNLKTDSFRTRVALGLVPGWTSLNKFGSGVATTVFRVVYPNMLNLQYPFLIDENKTMTIQSDNVGDTGQLIEVYYVEYVASDDSWRYKRGRATTNGTTPVTLKEVDEKTILTVEAKVGTGTAQVSAWFDGFVVENEYLK